MDAAISNQSEEQIRSKMITMRDQMSVLEWDERHGQINPYKKVQLDNLRKEYRFLEETLSAKIL